ncbi:MAG: rhomboid family intramembrane serine protease, partial [Planctomycetota bacterium]
MLIPLGTDRHRRRSAVVTYTLVAVCVVVFPITHAMPRQETLPYAVWRNGFEWWQLFTSAFLHGGWLHLIFNMLVLAALGPNVEDKLGHLRFILVYALGAAAAGGAHVAFSMNPAIGASGAIAAITGAYLVLFPKTRIICFAFWITVVGRIHVPAWWFIGLNIAIDLLAGGFGGNTGIAHAAHLGGYGFGIIAMMAALGVGWLSREPNDLATILRQRRRRAAIQQAVREQREGVQRRLDPERR